MGIYIICKKKINKSIKTSPRKVDVEFYFTLILRMILTLLTLIYQMSQRCDIIENTLPAITR